MIEWYRSRAGQNKTVFDDDDDRPEDRRSPLLTRRRNGIVQVKNETSVTDVTLPQGLPARIRVLRRICGFSQAQLAQKTGLSKDAIRRWEYGDRVPTVESLKILAGAFGVTIGKLCD